MKLISVLCILFSMVLFPLFAVSGTVSLFFLAAAQESLRWLTGPAAKRIDHAAARAMARRICHLHTAP